MQHALDLAAVQHAIQSASNGTNSGDTAQSDHALTRVDPNIVNIFAKAEADPSDTLLHRRHTMLDDSDVNHSSDGTGGGGSGSRGCGARSHGGCVWGQRTSRPRSRWPGGDRRHRCH